MRRPHVDAQRLSPLWVQAFKSDVPDTAELRRAYQRFSTRRGLPNGLRLGRWLIPGIALAAGTAYAATGAPSRFLQGLLIESHRVQSTLAPGVPSQPLRTAAPLGPSSPSPPTAQSQTGLDGMVHAKGDGQRPDLPATAGEPTLSPPSADAPNSVPLAGARNELTRPLAGRAEPRIAQPEAESTPAATGRALGGPASPPYADDAWQRAAQSLRNKDFSAADTALAEIEARGRPSERDAARLARAELMLASGRQAMAVPHLRDLAEHAKSSVVRGRARELLQRAEQDR